MKSSEAAKRNIDLLAGVAARLSAHRIESAYPEAEMLVRHYSKMDRAALFAGRKAVPQEAVRRIHKALKARIAGRAIQYVLKRADFYGTHFFVNEHVLIPRQETELLVERAAELLPRTHAPRALDVGTGSGCIAVCLTLARPDCRMTALDLSKQALAVARKNSGYHELGKKIECLPSDLFSAVKGRRFDLIVSNPPYIPADEMDTLPETVRAEPAIALNGGREGLEIIRRLVDEAPEHLVPGGTLLVEIGLGQSGPLGALLAPDKRYQQHSFIKDLAGIDRILEAKVHG